MVLHVLFVRQFVWPRFIVVRFFMLNLRLCFTPYSLTFSSASAPSSSTSFSSSLHFILVGVLIYWHFSFIVCDLISCQRPERICPVPVSLFVLLFCAVETIRCIRYIVCRLVLRLCLVRQLYSQKNYINDSRVNKTHISVGSSVCDRKNLKKSWV